jgi:hypothetical protein
MGFCIVSTCLLTGIEFLRTQPQSFVDNVPLGHSNRPLDFKDLLVSTPYGRKFYYVMPLFGARIPPALPNVGTQVIDNVYI